LNRSTTSREGAREQREVLEQLIENLDGKDRMEEMMPPVTSHPANCSEYAGRRSDGTKVVIG
jgi:hypothetical protein